MISAGESPGEPFLNNPYTSSLTSFNIFPLSILYKQIKIIVQYIPDKVKHLSEFPPIDWRIFGPTCPPVNFEILFQVTAGCFLNFNQREKTMPFSHLTSPVRLESAEQGRKQAKVTAE
jgi:hypothetical protein